jgi:hypothetical protein
MWWYEVDFLEATEVTERPGRDFKVQRDEIGRSGGELECCFALEDGARRWRYNGKVTALDRRGSRRETASSNCFARQWATMKRGVWTCGQVTAMDSARVGKSRKSGGLRCLLLPTVLGHQLKVRSEV